MSVWLRFEKPCVDDPRDGGCIKDVRIAVGAPTMLPSAVKGEHIRYVTPSS